MNKLFLLVVLLGACGGVSKPCPDFVAWPCDSPKKAQCVDGQWRCEPCKVDFAGLIGNEICGPDAGFVEEACRCVYDE